MKRDTTLGFLLIGAILVGYFIMTKPSAEEIEAHRKKADSLAAIQAKKDSLQILTVEESLSANNDTLRQDSISSDTLGETPRQDSDSMRMAQHFYDYGLFAEAVEGETEYITIENELLKITLSTLAGRMVSAELKDYKTYGGDTLYLFDEDSSNFNIIFHQNKKIIQSKNLYFKPTNGSINVTGEQEKTVGMRLYAGSDDKYIEFLYGLKGNSHTVDFDVNIVGLDDMVQENRHEMELEWSLYAPAKEKGIKLERNVTSVYYKYVDDEVDNITEAGDGTEELVARTEWVGFKQQFFSVVLMADKGFEKFNSEISSRTLSNTTDYTKHLSANLPLTFDDGKDPSFGMRWYLGPNHYQTLKSYEIGLEDQINLGWTIFGWVNEYLVIPIFNWLDSYDMGYGWIILILTIIIKLILFPLTYKNYKSSAKMRVLKPEVDAINEKHKDGDAMKKQQEVMKLYKSAGVNPMAGCIPMLLQMPILYAMFRFFPSSIELRQESFLWAEDLSTYDSIWDFGFDLPLYGDHISLFTLLMAASTFFYSKYNMQMGASGPQMAQMKILIYFMPIMLLCFFNDFAAGLSYYYFTANMISIGQQFAIKKWFINEKAIRGRIEINKTKPKSNKKSKFQQKLEQMQKQREQQMRQARKRKK